MIVMMFGLMKLIMRDQLVRMLFSWEM